MDVAVPLSILALGLGILLVLLAFVMQGVSVARRDASWASSTPDARVLMAWGRDIAALAIVLLLALAFCDSPSSCTAVFGVIASGSALGYILRRLQQRRQRRKAGTCQQCGYDMPSSSAPRCPKCGTVFTIKNAEPEDPSSSMDEPHIRS